MVHNIVEALKICEETSSKNENTIIGVNYASKMFGYEYWIRKRLQFSITFVIDADELSKHVK